MDNLIGATLFFSIYFGIGFLVYFLALRGSTVDVNDTKALSLFIVLGWPFFLIIGVIQMLCSLVEKLAGK